MKTKEAVLSQRWPIALAKGPVGMKGKQKALHETLRLFNKKGKAMDREILKQALIKRAYEDKKVNPAAAKGAVAGAAIGALTDKYKAEDALREAVRIARGSGVGEKKIESTVGPAIVNNVAPKRDDEDMKAMPMGRGHGLAATLAKSSAARELLKSALAKK